LHSNDSKKIGLELQINSCKLPFISCHTDVLTGSAWTCRALPLSAFQVSAFPFGGASVPASRIPFLLSAFQISDFSVSVFVTGRMRRGMAETAS
jgi:hypothetical protein